jgi:Holliday junction resolvasome RuvABC endonuclease subunit
MIIAGVDYSLTSPSICVHKGDDWSVDNCSFYYLVKKVNFISAHKQFHGSLYEDYFNDCHRFNNLSKWSMGVIGYGIDIVGIEGYAFGATGRVFQIAENAGLLKYKLWSAGIKFNVPAPAEIKKYATGKGNSNKIAMYEHFKKETGLDLFLILNITNLNMWNPISDIVDAYFIAKYEHKKWKEGLLKE